MALFLPNILMYTIFAIDIYNFDVYTMPIDKIKGKEAWLPIGVARPFIFLECHVYSKCS